MNTSKPTQFLNANDLKSRIDLREFVTNFLGRPQRQTYDYNLHFSPWRDDGQNASFAVYRNSFKDYGGSQEQGDIYDFIQRQLDLRFPEAVEWVAQHTGQSAPAAQSSHNPEPKQPTNEPPSADWQQLQNKPLERYQSYLWSDRADAKAALDYLHHKRGLSDDTIRQYGLGLNPKWDGKIASGIVIPIACSGALWALRIRTFDPKLYKYLNASGSHLTGTLFNADTIQAGKPILFVEGEFDAMLAQQELGDQVAVVTLGPVSNQLSNRWQKLIQAAGKIYIALDNDAPGHKAALKLAEKLKAWGKVTHIHTTPQGKDVTEFAAEYAGDLRAWFGTAPGRGWWPQGVPDTWRSALLNYFPDSIAPLMELLNDAMRRGLINPDNFNIKGLKSANAKLDYHIPPSTLTKGVKTLTDLFFSKLETVEKNNTVSKNEINKPKGRKSVSYRVHSVAEIKIKVLEWTEPRLIEKLHPTHAHDAVIALMTPKMLADTIDTDENPEALAGELNGIIAPSFYAQEKPKRRRAGYARYKLDVLNQALDDPYSTPLPEHWPKSKASEYRAAYAHAFVKANPNIQLSRSQLQEHFGISNGAIHDLVDRAGLEAIPQEITVEITSPENIQSQIKDQARKLHAYPLWIQVIQRDQEWGCRYDENSSAIIEKQLRNGAKVKIRYQEANRYQVINDEPLIGTAATTGLLASSNENTCGTEHVPTKAKPIQSHYGPTHDPLWVANQLKLHLERKDNDLLNPLTGEIVAITANPTELAEALLGRPIKRQPPAEPDESPASNYEPPSQPSAN